MDLRKLIKYEENMCVKKDHFDELFKRTTVSYSAKTYKCVSQGREPETNGTGEKYYPGATKEKRKSRETVHKKTQKKPLKEQNKYNVDIFEKEERAHMISSYNTGLPESNQCNKLTKDTCESSKQNSIALLKDFCENLNFDYKTLLSRRAADTNGQQKNSTDTFEKNGSARSKSDSKNKTSKSDSSQNTSHKQSNRESNKKSNADNKKANAENTKQPNAENNKKSNAENKKKSNAEKNKKSDTDNMNIRRGRRSVPKKQKTIATDPVALHEYYQNQWKKFSGRIPGQNSRIEVRSKVHQKFF